MFFNLDLFHIFVFIMFPYSIWALTSMIQKTNNLLANIDKKLEYIIEKTIR